MNPSPQVQKYESGSTSLNSLYILFFYENEPRYLFGGNAAFSKIHDLLFYQLMAEVTFGKICTRCQCQATLPATINYEARHGLSAVRPATKVAVKALVIDSDATEVK